jgi:hypothetical protein
MQMFLIVSFLSMQPVLGPVTECPVVVELVDVSWSLLPFTQVSLRDERTGATQTAISDDNGRARFSVQSCADVRCRFTISAGGRDSGFKPVTLKRLWFGEHQGGDRHVQIRLKDMTGPAVTTHE